MQLSNAPAKLTKAFAFAGSKNIIPIPSQIPITPGAASFTDGFPPLTMTDPLDGGVPPSGLDFNGVLFDLSAIDVWMSVGGGFPYDVVLSAAIGGYPLGARVLMAAGTGYWRSQVDNNTTDPDTGGAGWSPEGSTASSSVYASAQQTMAGGAHKILYDTVEFDSQGLWDATNKRFVAKWAGNYRLSGSTFLSAPSAATNGLASDIFKNGAHAKRCFQYPQVSDVDLSLPFSAVVALAVGDYLEAYLTITSSVTALAGIVGSNQAYVFAQIEYLGT
jgi:hypothetical protein